MDTRSTSTPVSLPSSGIAFKTVACNPSFLYHRSSMAVTILRSMFLDLSMAFCVSSLFWFRELNAEELSVAPVSDSRLKKASTGEYKVPSGKKRKEKKERKKDP